MKKLILLTSLLFFSSGAFALSCQDKVLAVKQRSNGDVAVLSKAFYVSYVDICNVDKAVVSHYTNNTISTESCRSILSILLAAQSTGMDIEVNYDDEETKGKTCKALGAGSQHVPKSVIYVKQNVFRSTSEFD